MYKVRMLKDGAWRDLAGPYRLDVAAWLLERLAPRYGRDRVVLTVA